MTTPSGPDPALLSRIKAAREAITAQLAEVVVGQDDAVGQILTAMFAGGHCIIQGPPGTAKTLLIGALARASGLDCKRIQFTPDLMPADISGTEVLEEDKATGRRVTKFVKGPVFTNIVMADEINRTPPKTQAALLEVMQERQVTIGGRTHALPKPFFVLATQINLEQEGTYPLPEAQMDRFMFSVNTGYVTIQDEAAIVRRTTAAGLPEGKPVIQGTDLLEFAQAVRQIALPPDLGAWIVDIVASSRPTVEGAPDFVKDWIAWGAGLRASQNIALAAKSKAAQDARATVIAADIAAVTVPVLRHRIGLSFRAEVDKVTVEDVVKRIIAAVPAPGAAAAAKGGR
ncbi:MAG: AAA family ATPase [Planctomycetes bacterium]|nr:AAA family ATPase [Planctomycetota bacterium]